MVQPVSPSAAPHLGGPIPCLAPVVLCKPTVRDVPEMMRLMEPHLRSERLLPRSPRQVAERLRDYTLAVSGGRIVGVGSMSLVDMHLAEVGVLIGEDEETTQLLLDAVLAEARGLGVGRAFVLTDAPQCFEAAGFVRTLVAAIPEKRDRQCLRCPRLPRCRQVALQVELPALELAASA